MNRILIVILSFFLFACGNEAIIEEENVSEQIEQIEQIEIIVEEASNPIKYNIDFSGYEVFETVIKKNENLSEILFPRGIDYPQIQKVVDLSEDVFDVRKLRAGGAYTLLFKNDSTKSLDFMIYEIDAIDYVVYDFADSTRVYREQKPVSIVEKTASGIIETSLWNTMMDNDLNQELILTLSLNLLI